MKLNSYSNKGRQKWKKFSSFFIETETEIEKAKKRKGKDTRNER
jgi:hypothetical protein